MTIPISPFLSPSSLVGGDEPPTSAGKGKNLAQCCQDFEAIFLQSLFKTMRSTVIDSGLFDKGDDQKFYQEMMDLQVAQAAAGQHALGLGQALLGQLQEKKK